MNASRLASIVAVSPEKSDPPGMSTAVVTVVSIALIAVTVLLLEVVYQRMTRAEEQRKIIAEQPVELNALEAEQRAQIESAPVPLDRAMQIVVDEARKGSAE